MPRSPATPHESCAPAPREPSRDRSPPMQCAHALLSASASVLRPASPTPPTTATLPPTVTDSLYSSSSSPTSPSPNHHHQSQGLSPPLATSSPEPQLSQPGLSQAQQPRVSAAAAPLVSRAKRRITKTRVFEIHESAVKRPHAAARFVQGRGSRLVNIPNVKYALGKAAGKDAHLELLHRVLFNCTGPLARRKANIEMFNGFVFRSERERALAKDKLLRAHFTAVKKVAYVLDIDVADGKEATADAILAFLEVPRVIEGRGNREEREKRERSQRKKLERERAKAVKEKKKREEEERNKVHLLASQQQSSDEDGDDDLEFEALSWIEIAQIRREQRRQAGAPDT